MIAYFISGLGADERIFNRLQLPSGLTPRYVQWIDPLKNEKLPDYCKRLSKQITPQEDFVLIGLSFGGMVAVELSKFLRPKAVILLSSISTAAERPPLFRVVNVLPLHRLVPFAVFKWALPIAYWVFSAHTQKEKQLLRSFINNVSPVYLKWAITQAVGWTNKERPPTVFHLHGTADRILPYQYTKADVLIEGGTHLMVYNQAQKISALLTEHLDKVLQKE